MPMLDTIMLGFLFVVAAIGLGWFVYELQKDEED